MTQTIYINIKEATEAVQSKERLDGYAFAMCIRFLFVSGRINNATLDRISGLLHMGKQSVSKRLKAAIKHGYVRWDGKCIVVVGKCHKNGQYVFPIKKHIVRKFARAKDYIPVLQEKFTRLKDRIRKIVAENHVTKQNDFSNTIECYSNPQDKYHYVWAKKRIKRMCKKEIVENTDKISTSRMMEVIGSSRSRTKRLMRELVNGCRLEKRANVEDTGIDMEAELGMSYTDPRFRESVKSWGNEYNEYRRTIHQKGFVIFGWEQDDDNNYHLMAYIQYANSYKALQNDIRLFISERRISK